MWSHALPTFAQSPGSRLYTPEPVNASHPLLNSCAAWWRSIDGVTASPWLDIVNNGKATLTGMASLTTGFRGPRAPGGDGNSILGSGASAYGTGPLGNALIPSTTITATLAAWARPNATSMATDKRIINFVKTGAVSVLSILVGRAANKFSAFGRDGGGSLVQVDSSKVYAADTWHWVVATVTGTTLTLYVDGMNVGSATVNVANTIGSMDVVGVGLLAFPGGSSAVFGGNADDLMILRRGWAPAEVAASYDLARRGWPGVLNHMPGIEYSFPSAGGNTITVAAASVGLGLSPAVPSVLVRASGSVLGLSVSPAVPTALINVPGASIGTGINPATPALLSSATAASIGLGISLATPSLLSAGAASSISIATGAAGAALLSTAGAIGVNLTADMSAGAALLSTGLASSVGLALATATPAVLATAAIGIGLGMAPAVPSLLSTAGGAGVGLGMASAIPAALASATPTSSGVGPGAATAQLSAAAPADGSGLALSASGAQLLAAAPALSVGAGLAAASGTLLVLAPASAVGLGFATTLEFVPPTFVAGPLFFEPPRKLTFYEAPRVLQWCDMQTEVKRPDEDRSWVWDFTREKELTAGATISSVVGNTIAIITVEAPTQPDVQPVIAVPAISGKQVSAFISGGTDGNLYRLDCLVLLSDGTSTVNRSGLLLVSSTAPIEPTQGW